MAKISEYYPVGLKAIILAGCVLILLASSCSLPIPTSTQEIPASPPLTTTPSPTSVTGQAQPAAAEPTLVSPTQTATALPTIALETATPTPVACSSTPVLIVAEAYQFFWLEDGRMIYQTSWDPAIWKTYDFQERISYDIDVDNSIIPRKFWEHRDELDTRRAAVREFEIENSEEGFISPDGESIVYLVRIGDGKRAEYYLRNRGTQESTYLTTLQGDIWEHYWFKESSKFLIAMSSLSPAGIADGHLFILDLESRRVSLTIPYGELFYRNVFVDETKIDMGRELNRWQYSFIQFDIATGTITEVFDEAPLFYRWDAGGNELMGIFPAADYEGSRVIHKNMNTGDVTIFQNRPIRENPWRVNSIQISPDFRYVVYIKENTESLYFIECPRVE